MSWTIGTLLTKTTQHFLSKNIESARIDAEILMAKALGMKRLDLYLNFERPILETEVSTYRELVRRRSQAEPVAYILNEKEFYGRRFEVGPGVLIPRPETEHLIDAFLEHFKGKPCQRILDAGSGSGCIGITVASEKPGSQVVCVDASQEAIARTKENAALLGADVLAEHVSFFDYSAEPFDAVLSNPPYVGLKAENLVSTEVLKHEPREALFGGEEGHELLEKWIPKMASLLKPHGLLLCEIGFDQKEIAESIAASTNTLCDIKTLKDYSNKDRVLYAIRKG